jgi:hypothetical protein
VGTDDTARATYRTPALAKVGVLPVSLHAECLRHLLSIIQLIRHISCRRVHSIAKCDSVGLAEDYLSGSIRSAVADHSVGAICNGGQDMASDREQEVVCSQNDLAIQLDLLRHPPAVSSGAWNAWQRVVGLVEISAVMLGKLAQAM